MVFNLVTINCVDYYHLGKQRINIMKLPVFYFLFVYLIVEVGGSFVDILSDPPLSLRHTLKKFSQSRHHHNARGKEKARRFIKKSFRESGLHVWSEPITISEHLQGENIIGLRKGRNSGTADDKIVIIGAHYDTTFKTKGVDDNGSGMTGLLEIAKQIGFSNCGTENTMMFVAFDFEEDTIDNGILAPFGSQWFVQNITEYLEQTGGNIAGTFILEMIANYNNSKDSQLFPRRFSMISRKAYNEVRHHGNRGNFLALIGREKDEKQLMTLLKKYYEKDGDFRAQPVPIPLTGRPRALGYAKNLRNYYRSDHYSFWENKISFRAVMITDTSNFRRIMNECYHRKCDNMRQISKKDLEFLRRNINAVLHAALDLAKSDSCDRLASLGTKRAAVYHNPKLIMASVKDLNSSSVMYRTSTITFLIAILIQLLCKY